MRLIEDMLQELREYSKEFNSGEISKEELNIKLTLLIGRIDCVQLDYGRSPFIYLPENVQSVFNSLTRQYKAKARVALTSLIETSNRASYNKRTRYLIEKKLFFQSLHNTIQRNVQGWALRKGKQYRVIENIFVLEELSDTTLIKENVI